MSANTWAAGGGGRDFVDSTDLDAYVAESLSLREHLARQTAVLLADPAERMIAAALIDGVDDGGYFVGSLIEIAERLGASADDCRSGC